MSLLADFLKNPRYQLLIQKSTSRVIEAMGAGRGDFCKSLGMLCCGNPDAKWSEIKKDVNGIFWQVFLSDTKLVEKAEAMLVEAQQALEFREISVEALWETVLRHAQVKFRSHVMEECRRMVPFKLCYQRIRQILVRSQHFMMRIVSDRSFFALPETPSDVPNAPSLSWDSLDKLPLPKEMEGPIDKLFKKDVLIPLAEFFWTHFIAIRCNGTPHFVSVYMFVLWLAKRYDLASLNTQVNIDTNEDEPWENSLSMDDFPASDQLDVADEELQRLAVLCTDRFQAAEVIVCALHFTEPAKTMQDIAVYMGLSGAGGVAPYKERCLDRLRSFMAEYSALSGGSDAMDRCAQDFLYLVHEECVKRLPNAAATWQNRLHPKKILKQVSSASIP